MQSMSSSEETRLSPMTRFNVQCIQSDNANDCRRCREKGLKCDRKAILEVAKVNQNKLARKFIMEQGRDVERIHQRLLGRPSNEQSEIRLLPSTSAMEEKLKEDLIVILSRRFPRLNPDTISETVRAEVSVLSNE